MATTFVKIATVTVGAGGSSSINFTSIPSTYTDLCLKVSLRGSTSQVYDVLNMDFNSNGNFNWRKLEGSGSAASSATGTNNNNIAVMTGANATASTFGSADIYIPNYTGSTNKSVSVDGVSENNAATAYTDFYASVWNNTAAITSITLTPQTSPFVQYSTATLYGISKS